MKVTYKIDFENIIEKTIDDTKQRVLQFYEKRKPTLPVGSSELLEYAYISKNDIVYKTQDGDQNIIDKKHLNDFIINIYNNINNKISGTNIVNKNKSSKPFYEMKILGTTIPLAVFLLINRSTAKSAFHKMKLRYQFRDKKDNDASVNLNFKDSNGVRHYLALYPTDLEQEYYANGLNRFKLKDSVFDPTVEGLSQALMEILINKSGRRFAKNLYEIEYKFIDGATYKILQDEGKSTDLAGVFYNDMTDMLKTRTVKSQYDLDNFRLRMSETITSVAYNQMHQAISKFKSRAHLSNEKIYMKNDFIIKNLLDAGILQYTKTLNPLEEMMISLKVTKAGIGNSLKNQINLQRRDMNESYFGTIAPTATNEYGGIGINQTLTNGAVIDDRFGSLTKKDFNNQTNAFANLSPVESLSAFFEYDDTTRRVMGNQQTGQFIQLENPSVPLVQTGFESYVPHLVSDRFVKKAKHDGVVEQVTDKIIKIKYKTGYETISIEPIKSRTKRGIYIATNYTKHVTKGQKVNKGFILASTDSLKKGKLAIGRNLVVAEMGYLGMNYEDGWVVSDTLNQKYSNKILQKINIKFPSGASLLDLNIHKGDLTKAGTTLIKFNTSEDFIDDEDLNDDEESIMVGLVKDGLTKSYLSPGGVIKEVVVKLNTRKLPSKLLALYKTSIETIENKTKVCKEQSLKAEKSEQNDSYMNCIGHLENSEALTIGGHKFNQEEIDGAIIEVYIEKENPVRNGSKFTLTSSGGKGTVQYIMEHGKEPISEETNLKIEFIGTPLSIISRKNPSILLSMYLGKVIYFLNKTVKELNKAGKILAIKKLVTEVFSAIDETDDSIITNQLKEFFAQPKEKITKIINNSDPLNDPAFPAIVPPFKNKLRIKNIQNAANVLGIPLNEKVKVLENNGIVTERSVPVGILPINMLEHFPQAMSSTRGSVSTGKNWITGQGRSGTKEGTGAIRVGLFDMNSLLSKQPYGLIKEMHAIKSDAGNVKKNMIRSIIKTNAIPSVDDTELEQKDMVALNLIDILFKGAGLKADFE